jgi:2-haloacid dehalogenase
MFPHAEEKYDWLGLFDGVVVSGRVKMVKPERDIFDHLTERYGLRAEDLFFIDDHEPNIIAARSYGIAAHLFRDAAGLRRALVDHGLLD